MATTHLITPLPPPPPCSAPPHRPPAAPPPPPPRPLLRRRSSLKTPLSSPGPRDDVAALARRARLSATAAALAAGEIADHYALVSLLSSLADSSPSSPSFLPLARALHALALRRLSAAADHPRLVLATALLDAYAKCGRADLARKVFDGMPLKNSVAYNTMIAGYMSNGEVHAALSLFEEMPMRDKVSWTAIIDGFVKNGLFEEALVHFREMQLRNVEPDYVTVIAVVSACAEMGSLGLGLWVHRFVMRHNFANNVRLANSFIDLYSRCGRIDLARNVFERMVKRTTVSWNSMIVGSAVNGSCREALEYFDMMQREGFEPVGVTFTGVLAACSHAGLVDEGLKYCDLMRKRYRIPMRVEHYGCLVDLLGRAGRLEEAMQVVESMPMKPNEVVLGSLLAACRVHGHVGLAERLMAHLAELEPETDSNYVLLSNVYAAVGRWDGVGEVRNMMKARGIKKKPGFSSVEIDGGYHEFVAGDRSHPESDDIYATLGVLRREMRLHGYEPIAPSGMARDSE